MSQVTLLNLSILLIKCKLPKNKMIYNLKILQYDLRIMISLIFLIMIYGCCTPSTELSHYKNAEHIGKEKLGDDFEMIKNNAGSFVLFRKMGIKKNHPHTSINYFVYDLKNGAVIFEENLVDSEVNWLDETHLYIKSNPEIISGDEDINSFILNILTKEKIKSDINN